MKSLKNKLAIILAFLISVSSISLASAQEIGILGDADKDSVISISDATLIQKYIAKLVNFSDEQILCSDVNQDGVISINDVTEIQKYLAHLNTSSQIGEPVSNTEPTTEPITETTTEPTTEPITEATTEPTTEPTTESTTESTTEPTTEQVNEDLWKENTGIITLSNSGITVTGVGATVEGNKVIITEGGDWEVVGSCDDGMIYVNTGEEKDVNDKVKLRLNGMSLTNTNGPAIYFDRCKKAFITLESDTINTICDSKEYADEYAEAKAVLHSDDSLEIKGKGTLNATSLYKHGINSDDDLVIENGIFNIQSTKDGLHANDYITLDSKNIKLNITSSADGVESEGDLTINKATVNITADGKGIKATNDLNILSGKITVNSTDDTVHSNANITITDGTLSLSSGDDGVHADTTLTIDGGTINVIQSYEGLEANDIIINGGTISVTASDDGINAAGGNDSSSINGRPGQNNFKPSFNSPSGSSSTNCSITITGGYVYVVASGDGIDSNGSLTISGGTVISQGPQSSSDCCFDADNTIQITGGTVIGISSSQAMWSDVSGKVSGAIYNYSVGTVSQNSTIAVADSSGNVLSIIKSKLSGNLGIIYFTDKTESLSSCHFVINGSYSGSFDDFGYAESGTISGGTTVNPSKSTSNNGGKPSFGR